MVTSDLTLGEEMEWGGGGGGEGLVGAGGGWRRGGGGCERGGGAGSSNFGYVWGWWGGGLDMQFKALRCRPKSLDTSRDSLFILKHATDFAGEKVH